MTIQKVNQRKKPQPELILTKGGIYLPRPNRTTQWFICINLDLIDNPIIEIREAGLINLYLGDHEREILHDNHLYYLFNPTKFTKQFDKFCYYCETLPLFTELYDVRTCDMGKVMIVMEMPDKYKQLKGHFLKGEYSLFPEEYMKTYYNNLKQFDIWSKSPELRKELEHKLDVKLDKTAELEEIPKLHEEIFNYNKEIKI
jgi:hypothetical protein